MTGTSQLGGKSGQAGSGAAAAVRGMLRVLGRDTPCFSAPCLNGGTCHDVYGARIAGQQKAGQSDVGADSYECECMLHWAGAVCEDAMEPCEDLEQDCGARACACMPPQHTHILIRFNRGT